MSNPRPCAPPRSTTVGDLSSEGLLVPTLETVLLSFHSPECPLYLLPRSLLPSSPRLLFPVGVARLGPPNRCAFRSLSTGTRFSHLLVSTSVTCLGSGRPFDLYFYDTHSITDGVGTDRDRPSPRRYSSGTRVHRTPSILDTSTHTHGHFFPFSPSSTQPLPFPSLWYADPTNEPLAQEEVGPSLYHGPGSWGGSSTVLVRKRGRKGGMASPSLSRPVPSGHPGGISGSV